MSYEIGRKIINLEPAERVGRTEYADCYPSLVEHFTGVDPWKTDKLHETMRQFYEMVGYDFLWYTYHDQWPGRVTSMGHAEFSEGGVDINHNVCCPFLQPEEVLDFDASVEYGLPDIEQHSAVCQSIVEQNRRNYPDLVNPGGYYKTLISGAIQAFGWEMLLLAQAVDPKKFGESVLDGFFKLSMAHFEAWARTDIECFICHDDMVWTEGAIFRPDFYREYIFPRYRELWKPLKERGIKVIYCSDGNYTEFVDDIATAGADGFVFEPMTSLEYITHRYGRTHVIVGNADTRILTWGSKEDIETEVKRCMKAAKDCPGFIMAVGNHIPANVPIENALHYFDLVNKLGARV